MSMKKTAKKKTALVIFLEDQNRERVQAQFSDALGTSDSNALYRAFLEDTMNACLKVPNLENFISYPTGGKVKKIVLEAIDRLKGRVSNKSKARLEKAAPDLWEQKDSDTSKSMSAIFSKCFDLGYKRVLLIDCVTPTITQPMLQNAAAALISRDLVFGPTLEGSFYLVGMSKLIPHLFSNIDWAVKDGIYSRIVQLVQEDGLDWQELELWYNLRQPGDLEFVARDINAFRIAGDESSAEQTH